MGKIIYFTGGSRSGKSLEAEKYIKERDYDKKIYVATSIVFDEEMKSRVEKHKKQRGDSWTTVEGYSKIVEKILPHIEEKTVILLDCLTNMVTNLMIMENSIDWDKIATSEVDKLEKEIEKEVVELFEYIKASDVDMVVVSNELGLGLVPTYPLGRYFRDIAGHMNQIAGRYSDEAYMVLSGLKLKLK